MNSQKFFLYARKSTDVEDKQVRSIEDQMSELRTFAKQENLEIVDIFIEKQSAKIPGRPIFNDMIKRIEKGEANRILAWHPDRLARNSVDGGKIIYLLDCGRIQALKFPHFWFEPTPQGKFMLNIAFGQSKYLKSPKIATFYRKRSLSKKSLARTSFCQTARPALAGQAKGKMKQKINGRRCAPPTKKSEKSQKVNYWSG
ncbi:MAG: recombinase family protein [bacterium]